LHAQGSHPLVLHAVGRLEVRSTRAAMSRMLAGAKLSNVIGTPLPTTCSMRRRQDC